ncbi:MAG: hypothetical protein LC768_07205 [Acidobacteria bacterium]|nr:hypothetical protein [Acidobacteriota bacterium]MCA1638110.1 hypothetical protein [Acidobacteriota bacterium]
MKIKLLTVLSLAAFLCLGGCRSTSNTNTNTVVTNTTANTTVTTTTPMPTMAATDNAAKAAVEDALRKKGITGVSVEATADAITLRGTVAKGKMTEAMMAATDAGKRRVINQLTENK